MSLTEQFTFLLTSLDAITNATLNAEPFSSKANFSIEVRRTIKQRRKAGRKWERTRDSTHKTIFNKRRKEVKGGSFTSFILSLDNTRDSNYSLGKVAKATKKLPNYIPSIRRPNSWARREQEKVNIFLDHHENAFIPNNIPFYIIPAVIKSN